jgi:ribosome-binding protein aMBF1 (putative translation factor)
MRYIELGRRDKHYTQHQLARLVRCDQAFISMLERGVAQPTPEQAARLEAALGIRAEQLCDEIPFAAVEEQTSQEVA